MQLKAAETDRDAAASALAAHAGGGKQASEDKGGAAASDPQWDGRMLPSVKRLSTREEELYKHQLAELQAEVTALRKVSRAARGAEADSSVGMHQLEARLAVAAIEHKQDVRRMTETIEVRPRPALPLTPPTCLPEFPTPELRPVEPLLTCCSIWAR